MGMRPGTKCHKYTEEEMQFLKEHSWKRSTKELTALFNKKYGTQISEDAIKTLRVKNGFLSGNDARFKKGHTAPNKGKKRTDYMPQESIEKCKKTQFKKGHVPVNYRPIGSERVNVDGYVEIKIADPNKWMTRNRYIWKQKYGEIPRGHVIVHKNGNKLDDRIENLEMISWAELARLNQINHERGVSPDMDEAIIKLAKINAQIGKIQKIRRRRNEKKTTTTR